MKKFFTDFKKFISKGNVIDLAVAVVIGNAFNAIVTSLVKDIIMPLVTFICGANSIDDLSIVLRYTEDSATGQLVPSLTWNYGNFIQKIIDFLIIALSIFIMLRVLMKARETLEHVNKSLSKNVLTKAEKKDMKSRNLNYKNAEDVKTYNAQIEAEKQALEAEKAEKERLEKLNNPTEKELLTQIRDLLIANTKQE